MNILLNEALLATKHISHAAILKRKDGAIKAKSQQFRLSPQDLQKIQLAFENPREARSPDGGISLMDVNYKAVRADTLSVYAKKDRHGIVICRTNLHYIVATYDPNMYPSVAVESVEKLAEYFRKKNK